MAIRRISPGRYTDGKLTVDAKTKEEAEKKIAALYPSKPKPKPTKPPVIAAPTTPPIFSSDVVWLDVLGGAMYADACVQAAAYLIKKGHSVGIGFFWVEFFSAKELLDRLYNVGVRHFRIQALWRSSHVYGSAEQVEALKYAKEIQSWSAFHADAKVYFSPFCEHNVAPKIMLPYFEKLIKAAPSLPMVNSVWQADTIKDPRIIHEIHSVDKPAPSVPYFVSGDGCLGDPKSMHQGLVDVDIFDWHKLYSKAIGRLGWILRFNLNEAKQDKIPPKKRKAKASMGDILAMAWILLPLPPKPSIPGVKDFPVGDKAWVWKCYSEDVYNANKGEPENSRERKPVCIFPKGGIGKTITITDINGRKVCTSSPGQSYSGGGFRYYFGLFGWEMAEAAFKSSGSEWVIIQVGKEKYLVHPAFRTGYFR